MKPEVLSTIYAETVARRKLPINFHDEDLPLFEGELERVIPATRLLKFENVLASPEGLLFKGRVSCRNLLRFRITWMSGAFVASSNFSRRITRFAGGEDRA